MESNQEGQGSRKEGAYVVDGDDDSGILLSSGVQISTHLQILSKKVGISRGGIGYQSIK